MDNIQQVKLRRRILSNIQKHDSGCWLWLPKTRKHGYGQITYQRNGRTKHTSPHRLAYILFRNRFDLLDDKNLFVCHRCDNKDCVNPEHMFVGDWLENAMDDVLRNPNVSKQFMLRIVDLYRAKHGLRHRLSIKSLVSVDKQQASNK